MAPPALRNRLLAIVAADVAGYSRLMSMDDRATVTALDAARAVFRQQIAAFDGRVIDMAGDSVLAVFDSAVAAVQAALAVQQVLAEDRTAADRRLQFRIGVHVGDVIEKADGSVYGDGVNIAARLESLASPGALAVSHAVQAMLGQRVAAVFEDLGEHSVKNFTGKLHAYGVRPASRPSGQKFEGGRVYIDANTRQLWVNGQAAKLGGRAFDLLLALCERRDRLVSKQELLDVVWPGLIVEENNLQVHVMTLRRLLGAQAISTVSGRGYRFTLVADAAIPLAPEEAVTTAMPTANPPPRVDDLIGRADFLQQVMTQILAPDTRLLTLTGPGGSGKTRVGLRASAQLASHFADGTYVVLLAPVRDARQLMAAVAHALGLQEAGAVSLAELVKGYLQPRQVLLLLDNLEHLPDAAAPVADLLQTCPRLKVLVTSRLRLHLAQEHQLPVPPLDLPVSSAVADVLRSSAVALFVARAAALGREVLTQPDELQAVVQICRRLDGLPLAIELAAARLRVLTPAALAARLHHSLPLLKGGHADAPQRQQTLRNAIHWSFELLDASTQALFCRLGVFAGGWSMQAAEALAGSDAALDGIETLIDHSLVQRVDDVQGEPRFAMLETIREFALEQLALSGHADAAQDQHAAYFMALAAASAPHLTSGGRQPWLLRLRAEMNNLRLALNWLIRQRRDAATASALAASMVWLWYFDGLYREGLDWMDEVTALPGALEPTPPAAALRSGMARLAGFMGDAGYAKGLAQDAVARWRALGQTEGLAFALFHLGIPTMLSEGREAAASVFQEARQCFQASGHPWGVAVATVYEGVVMAFGPGAEDAALALLNEGLARCVALGDDWAASTCSGYIGSVALRRGDLVTARRCFGHILEQARQTGDRFRLARSGHLMAELHLMEGQPAQALSALTESLALTREQGRPGDLPQLLRVMAVALVGLGRHAQATQLLGTAMRGDGPKGTLPPDNPQAAAQAVAACRAALDAAAFDSAWQRGAMTSVERAVEQALSLDTSV